MSDELEADELAKLLPEVVRNAYAEEQAFIDDRVQAINNLGETGFMGWFRAGTEWLPWIGDVMTESPKGPAAATSNVNREARFRAMANKLRRGWAKNSMTRRKRTSAVILRRCITGPKRTSNGCAAGRFCV
jgi:hypothetical protein